MSQDVVSLIERGRTGRMPLDTVDRVARGVDAELVVYLRWRGGELDRLLDAAHAALVAAVARRLRDHGWHVQPEVTYQVYGERGSVDLLAWRPPTGVLLVVEVKSELTSLEETLRRHDEKVRLAARIARDRMQWRATSVARLLVLPDATSSRRRVREHRAILDPVYPMRGPGLRRWLSDPSLHGSSAGGALLFVRYTTGDRGVRVSPMMKRVRRSTSRTPRAPRPSGEG